MERTVSFPHAEVEIDERTVFFAALVVTVETAIVWLYVTLTGASITEPRYILYSWLWIDVGLLAVATVDPSPDTARHRLLGLVVAATYYLMVMYVPGNVAFTPDGSGITGFRIGWAVPAWGPILAYNSAWLRFYLLPFEVVGYAALAYLVYATALDAARAAVPALLGLVTCVGCTVPAFALLGIAGGASGSIAAAAYQWSYDVGTLVYLVTVGVLYTIYHR